MLLGAPIFGLFGDVFGPRAALLVSFFSAIACYTVIAMGNSIPALFLSRLFCLTKHAGQGKSTVGPCFHNPIPVVPFQGCSWW